jgi:hypothetical protein
VTSNYLLSGQKKRQQIKMDRWTAGDGLAFLDLGRGLRNCLIHRVNGHYGT